MTVDEVLQVLNVAPSDAIVLVKHLNLTGRPGDAAGVISAKLVRVWAGTGKTEDELKNGKPAVLLEVL